MRPAHRRLAQEPLESRMLLSISPTLIDLDSASYSEPADFVQVGEICYFTAESTDYGRELWATDGTEAGTHLVKDINDGTESSNPSDLVELDGKLYFAADDGENGTELWVSDGTEAGTVMVTDIYNGTSDSLPSNLAVVDGTLYFSATDAEHGTELWKSDGTASGTVLVKDINTGTSASNPMGLVDVDGTLFFVAEDGTNGFELWKSDGTASGTVLVADINDGDADAFTASGIALVAVDDTLFFVGNDGEHGYELWTSDGTESGTVMVKDIHSGSDDAFSVDSLQFAVMDGILYFAADDGAHGDELWRSDGTGSGTYLLKDINDGSSGNFSYFTGFTLVDDVLYFSADDGEHGKELWKTDGTTSGTVLVKDIETGSDASYPYNMTVVDGVLYFSAYSDTYGREIWKCDGTEEGTVLVSDGIPGEIGVYPVAMEVVGNYLVFSGYTGNENELFSLDLTAAGMQNARLSIWVDGEEVEIPANLGVYSDASTAAVYTVNSYGEILLNSDEDLTLDTFFEIWRTNAGLANDNSDATFGSHELMGYESDSSYTVQMFVNGEVCTDFENYVIGADDEIILIYSDNPVVSINTNFGSIVMELFEDETPITVENFLSYIHDEDYLNSIFHRSDPDFMIQGGGYTTNSSTFTGTSQFTAIASHGQIQNESLLANDYGTVAMARTDDYDSATSQFFINLEDNDFLNPSSSTSHDGYAVFGHVLDMTGATRIESLLVHEHSSPFAELPYSSSDQLVVVESVEGLGDITGYKFHDTDLDGVFDSNETGIEGVTVFIDANDNGVLDDGETWAVTDSDGKYLLQAGPGTHTVCAEVTSGHTATVESVDVTVEIGVETNDANLGEGGLLAPTGIDLVDESDTGSYDDDNLTNRNNADSNATLQFLVSGVADGAEVRVYCDGVEIGVGIASGSTVTVTTDGETAITDGAHVFTATQEINGVESDASDSLTLTTDTAAPAAIATTAPEIAEILVDYVFDADSPDEGGDGIFYSLSGAPDGMTIDPDTGEISWTPTAEQDVPQLFDIIVSDAAGNESIQTVDMTVLGVIHAYPDSYPSYTVEEDSELTIDASSGVLLNDDPDNEFSGLEAYKFSDPAHGTVSIGLNGSFVYTPEENFYGTDTFTYYLKSGTDESNVATVKITVTNVQDPPVGEDDEYSVEEDTDLIVDATTGLLANDYDVDGDSLTVTIVDSPQHGTITSFNAETGAFTYEPDPNYWGADSFTYTLSDGTSSTDPITVDINVDAMNDVPTVEDDDYTMDEDETLSVDADNGVLSNDSDVDGDSLTATIVDSPAHGTVTSFNATTGAFTYVPDENFAGTDTFTYTVSDGTAVSETVTVTIAVANVSDDPIAEDDAFDVDNDSAHTLDVLNNDEDPDASDSIVIVSVTQGSDGGIVSIIDGNEILYTPASDFTGTETFTYTIEDEAGNAVTATVTMTVEEGDGNSNETGDSSLSGYVYVDIDGDGQFDSNEVGLPGVLVMLTGTSDAGNSITRKQLTDNDGHYSFDDLPAGTYTLTESQPEIMIDGADSTPITGASVSGDAISGILLDDNESFENSNFGEKRIQPGYVTVRMHFASTSLQEYLRTLMAYGEECVENHDLADAIRDGITDYDPGSGNTTDTNTAPDGEDDGYTVNEDTTLTVNASQGVLDNDSDDDNDTLIASLLSGPSHGTLSLDSDGSFEYTPDAEFSGADTFTYVVYDGTTISDTVTVTLTVSEVNDPPVGVADEYTASENTALTVNLVDGVLDNDIDPDSAILTAELVSNPEHGTLAFETNGAFTYTPGVNFVGSDTFTYYVSDGTSDSVPVTVTINVLEGEDVPVAADDEYSVVEDSQLVVDAANGVLANDVDADGDPLEIHIATDPQHGTLAMEDDGSFTYTPYEDYYGTDTFTYYVTDNLFESEEVTVTIDISPVNDAPVGENDTYTVLPNTQLDINVANGVLFNDTDVEGNALTAELVSGVEHGVLTWSENNDGSFTYTPAADYHGIDTFTYKVSDGNLYSEEITVSIHVNTPAAAQDDAYEIDEDYALDVGVDNGLLFNDTDAEGDLLEVDITVFPEHGTLEWDENGSFKYTPDPHFHGVDTFTYVADDGYANPTEATVTITVNSVNDAPLAEGETYTVDEDGELNLSTENLLLNDTDVDSDDLEVVLDSDPANGTITWTDEENGLFTYTPDPDFHGTDSFTYHVTDGELDSDPVTVTITVNSVNDAPVGEGKAYTMDEDGELNLSTEKLLINATDVDGDDLEIVLDGDPANGTITWTDEENGLFKYTPDPDFHGTDSFTYHVTDGELDSDPITVTITVNSINDLPVATADEVILGEVQATDIDVLANDTDQDTEDTLTIDTFDATSTKGATITLNTDGTLHYDPSTSASLSGGTASSDSFTYTVTDGHTGVSVTGTVTVTFTEAGTFIVLNGDSISVDGLGATVDGSTLTITSAGTYHISGTLDDGQVLIDTDDTEEVNLIFDGVNITCSDNAPITVVHASTTVITLADDTENTITDGTTYADTNGPDAAIYSNNDLVIEGNGSLTVSANYHDGIACLEDFSINGGSIMVTAVNHGIRGKDSVVILDGTVTVDAGGNGIQSDNSEDASKGTVTIEGGTLYITTDSDGIQAETTLTISGGDVTIFANGQGLEATADITIENDTVSIDINSAEDAIHAGGTVTISGGDLTIDAGADGIVAEGELLISGGTIKIATGGGNTQTVGDGESAKALKADGAITVTGGTIMIDSADDAIYSDNTVAISGGAITITSGGNGIHAENEVTIDGGDIDITKSDDGVESNVVTINDGTIHLVSSDDGINIAGGLDGSGSEFTENSSAHFELTGGYVFIDAQGDGCDASGSVSISGGTLIISGATGDTSGAVNHNGTFEVTGGFLLAIGSPGMIESTSESSTQETLAYSYDSMQSAGVMIHIETEGGEEILTFVPTKDYQSIVLCSGDLTTGVNYVLYSGGSSNGTETDGLYTDGTYTGGTQVDTVTIS